MQETSNTVDMPAEDTKQHGQPTAHQLHGHCRTPLCGSRLQMHCQVLPAHCKYENKLPSQAMVWLDVAYGAHSHLVHAGVRGVILEPAEQHQNLAKFIRCGVQSTTIRNTWMSICAS